MQRDIDLMRQLLLDIERRGDTCAIDTLRTDAQHDGDERVRYHLRLLTDAGLVKEIGQTAAGTPCVRLTHAGQEFIELARSDARWREAKAAVLASTGGVPLSVLRALLMKWVWRSVIRRERRRIVGRRRYRRYVEQVEPETWLDADAVDPDALWDDNQTRPARERRIPAGWEPDLYSDVAAELADAP
ncbi:MAG TPA: DUF2513 domain-containing protein, partial [Burkholderiales bacterium]|nr:DUF2513 domain-containing protein [Burkholderiales bacterium]